MLGCDSFELNELHGGPSYSSTKLENEVQELTQLGEFEYSIKKFCEPVLQVLHYVAATAGFITACQWIFWTLCIVKRMLAACCKPPMPVKTDNEARADVLLDCLMSALNHTFNPHHTHKRSLLNVGVRFTSKADGEGDLLTYAACKGCKIW